ncbi:putative glycolipid-binding domain-containing protein [Geminicoccus roseus]|uniref:putative glycolipid-binding domain-containing protein n=1 Tax=Geminicoccus roseus TaxID=404900 RepID=UPI0004878A04|nr:putative glycolipid-binding domain-containing protein [Geminicoccus roseus]
MVRKLVARWKDWNGRSVEHLVVSIGPDGIDAEGVYVAADADGFAARYRISCDGCWRTRRLEVETVGGAGRRVLLADGVGHWQDAGGHPLPELDGAIDPDLSITPFTNTLPIRRIGDTAGADILTAWVSFPDLAVHRDPQRYTCLQPGRRWRYESRDSDFSRDLEIDADGLVITYPGLFRRIL